MSLTKLNYDALQEEFCVWYFRYTKKLPDKNIRLSRPNLVKAINFYKRRSNKDVIHT